MSRILLALFILVGASLSVAAQDYPTHPVSIVVPLAPGGPTDVVLRLIQPKMEAELGQPIVIDSRPGMAGNLGTAYVAKAAPDGYTLLIQATNIGMFPHLFTNLPYDPLKDFAIVGSVAESPGVVAVNRTSPIQSLSDLLARAKANPGSTNYGSAGAGSPTQLAAELLFKLNGVKLTHVPYKGGLPAVNDLLGNFVDSIAVTATAVLPFVQDGKLRALAVTSAIRFALLPDVPTIKELGFGDVNESVRYSLFAPAMTPRPIVERLSKALASALADPTARKGLAVAGFEVSGTTPAEVKAQMQHQYDLWGPVVKELNLKFD